jgi:branched-chain amino acid transport system permease protein
MSPFLKRPFFWWIILLVLGLLFDFTMNDYFKLILIFSILNSVLALGLNLVNGFTGQFSLGHAGFMAVGAYTSGYLSLIWMPFSGVFDILNYLILALISGSVAAFTGFLVGLPSLRLRGDYLAIVTLGFGEIIRVIILNSPKIGGARGLAGIPGPSDISLGSWTLSRFLQSYTITMTGLLLTCLLLWRILRSNTGRLFLSIREDEIAAQSMGINITNVKVKSFVLSSFLAGVGGSFFAHITNYLNPSSFSFMASINFVVMIVLGGMGSLTGSVIAAFFVTLLPEFLRPIQDYTGVDLRMVIFSVSLVLLMILQPQGLMGRLEIMDVWRKYVRKLT